jgi:general secretion pathway protein D
VVRDSQTSDRLSMDRYELMRSGLQAAQPAPSSLAPINEAPLLPALPAGRPAAVAAPKAQP